MKQSGEPTGLLQSEQIVLQQQDGAASTLALTGDVWLIGRDPAADLKLSGPAVSRTHARLARQADHWTVTDLDSTNGSYLDGERLAPGIVYQWPVEVDLTIGAYTLRRSNRQPVIDETVFLTPEEALALEDALTAHVAAHAEGQPNPDDREPPADALFAFEVEEQNVAGDRISRLKVRATGQESLTVTVNASSDDPRIEFRARSWRLLLIPGVLIEARVVASVRARPLIGRVHRAPYTLQFVSNRGAQQSYASTLLIRPYVAPAQLVMLLALFLLGAAALSWLM